MKQPKGFTLVELLVVIGIIALLVSMLLPALNKARQASMNIECQSNLRQLGIYAMMYTHDERGWLPINGGADKWHYWEVHSAPWATRLRLPAKQGNHVSRILRCPLLWNALQPNKNEGTWTALSTYGLNMYMGGSPNGRTPSDKNGMPNNGYHYTSLRIKQLKPYKYWFADGPVRPTSGHTAGDGYWDMGGMVSLNQSLTETWPFPWGKYKVPGHPQNSANFLMGDGHVENYTLKEINSWPVGARKQRWIFTGQVQW